MAPTWEDLDVGAAAEPRTVGPLTRTDFVRYQGASGDFNPIHHDEEFAKSAGYPSVFSVGMLQAGILAAFATDWLGAANVRRYSVQFREQVWPNDCVVCSGVVTRRYEEAGERKVDVDALFTHRWKLEQLRLRAWPTLQFEESWGRSLRGRSSEWLPSRQPSQPWNGRLYLALWPEVLS